MTPEINASGRLDRNDDVGLVMAAISDVAALAAFDESLPPLFAGLPPQDGAAFYRTTFDREPPAEVHVTASSSSDPGSFIVATFDLAELRRRLVSAVSSGVSNSEPVVELLGGLPLSVSSRIDAAHDEPDLASHFVASAADHLTEAVRCVMKDSLVPLDESEDRIQWTSAIPSDANIAWRRLPALLAFASQIHFVTARRSTP